nr:hypothetical protein [Melioribacteraceae bacterium]
MYKEIYHIKSDLKPSIGLPLSWTNIQGDDKVSIIKIGRKSIWLNGGSFYNTDNFTSIIKNLSKTKKVVIRGCNKSVSQKLKENGFSQTLFAQEAIIELCKEIPIS